MQAKSENKKELTLHYDKISCSYMKKTIFILTLSLSMLCANASYAQEIPEDVKNKIIEASKTKDGWNNKKREAWIVRQVEAWESINSTTFIIPKTEVDKIKALAQAKFPYHYSKQESYINEQAEAMTEIFELKSNFAKDEYDSIFNALCKSTENNYRKVADEINNIIEYKEEIKNLTIEGMDATTLAITKKVVAQQFPNDYKKQLQALKKQAKMLDSIEEAKEQAQLEKEKQAPKELSRTDIIKNAENAFKKSTLIVNGNGKTVTGIVTKVNGENALIFPACAYSLDGISVSSLGGDEAKLSLKKCYSAQNAPVMLTFLDELSFEVTPFEIVSNDELKSLMGGEVMIVGYFGETLRSSMIKLTKIVNDTIKTGTPIVQTYYEGSLIITPKTNKALAMCYKPAKELKELDFTSNRLNNELNRLLSKETRYMEAFRNDVPLKWVPVNKKKMAEQIASAEQLKDINIALSKLISGSLEEGARDKVTASIAEKYKKVLDTRMDISKVKVEYRSFISNSVNLLRRPLAKINKKEIYANMRNELGLHWKLAKMFEEELKNEMKKNSNTLAPREFKRAFGK